MNDFFDFPVKTSFRSVPIPASATTKGIPLGQGACIGVRLYLPNFVLNTQTLTSLPNNQAIIYYGDSMQQMQELVRGVNLPFMIYCTDLNQIYVRCNGIANEVQVQIYTRADALDN